MLQSAPLFWPPNPLLATLGLPRDPAWPRISPKLLTAAARVVFHVVQLTRFESGIPGRAWGDVHSAPIPVRA